MTEYQRALELSSPGAEGRGAIVEAYVPSCKRSRDTPECIAVAAREWAALSQGTSRLNVVLAGLGCGSSTPKSASRGDEVAAFAREATRMATEPSEPILADDRSSLFQELVSYLKWNEQKPEAKIMAARWRAFLDREAARAETPAARVVFDSHRVEAYLELGQPELALPMLEQSERDFPDDYNTPSRLAKVNLALGRLDLARAAIERAESRVYGPRKLRVAWLKADILVAMEKPKEAKQVLALAAALGDKLELTGGYRDLLVKIRQPRRHPVNHGIEIVSRDRDGRGPRSSWFARRRPHPRVAARRVARRSNRSTRS